MFRQPKHISVHSGRATVSEKIVGTLPPPSLPPLDVTQRSLGALRDIQKTAARETKFLPTVFFFNCGPSPDPPDVVYRS